MSNSGRVYTVEFENISITNANGTHDLFEITPAANKPCIVHGVYLDQISDVGDAQEEILRLRFIRGHTTSGSGGASPTPRPLVPSDGAAGFTAETANTTLASVGTVQNLHSGGFNVRIGWEYIPTPETRIQVTAANTTLVLRLMAAVADDITLSGTMYVEELG